MKFLHALLANRNERTEVAALTLGGVPIPSCAEPTHFLVAGSTGTGKSTLIGEALQTIANRDDRAIVIDPNSTFFARFGRAGDTILNPFDQRSPGWTVFNEVQKDFDFDRLARSLIPDGQGAERTWHGYAQGLTADLLRALTKRGETTASDLMHWASIASASDLYTLLADTASAGLFQSGADKALASTRFILATQLHPQKYVADGDFSLRTWLRGGTGNLFLTWRSDMLASLRPLFGCWVDVLLNEALALPPDETRRIWLICDELSALGQLSSLESALTMGRKHGLCVFAGLQSVAQLDRLYGRDTSTVLRSCFRSLIVLGIAKTDPATAEEMSKALGEREIDREQRSSSQGSGGITRNTSVNRVKERLVLPSEIAELPDLHGYLALAGNEPIRRIQILLRNLPTVNDAFEGI